MKVVSSSEIGAVEMIAVEGWMHPVRSGLPWVATLNGPGGAPMGYDYHIGVDYHKAYSHIIVQDTDGKTLRVRNDSRAVSGLLSPFSGNADAVMEATRNWKVMFDWLDEICDEVKLAHPLKVKAIADRPLPLGVQARSLCRSCAFDLFLGRQDVSRPDHQAGQQVAALVVWRGGAVSHDPDMRADYERLKVTKGANRAIVATARRLLSIAFLVLRDGRSYKRRGAMPGGAENVSRLS